MQAATIDRELDPVLRQMEQRGVLINIPYFEQLAADLEDRLAVLEEEIFTQVGHPFLLNSPKQLSQVLFDELHLAAAGNGHLRKKKTGFSTAAGALEKLRDRHPVVGSILQYREVGKLLSTYVRPLPALADPAGRLHTHYAPDAASGRLSSRRPNLQNIPIRTELGRQIRRGFIAAPGRCFLALDYSQIQLRIIAHLAGDAAMLTIFRNGGDIHAATSTALGVDRRTAKAVNFGIIYGLTAYGLAEALGVKNEEAQGFIDGFLTAYPGVARYMQASIDQALANGYSETLFGKRRLLPELTSANEFIRRAGERVALNHPVQGTEAEIMKLAMIALANHFGDRTDCQMILQVHDELIFELEDRLVADEALTIQRIMETIVQLTAPLEVECKTGSNWADLAKWPT